MDDSTIGERGLNRRKFLIFLMALSPAALLAKFLPARITQVPIAAHPHINELRRKYPGFEEFDSTEGGYTFVPDRDRLVPPGKTVTYKGREFNERKLAPGERVVGRVYMEERGVREHPSWKVRLGAAAHLHGVTTYFGCVFRFDLFDAHGRLVAQKFYR